MTLAVRCRAGPRGHCGRFSTVPLSFLSTRIICRRREYEIGPQRPRSPHDRLIERGDSSAGSVRFVDIPQRDIRFTTTDDGVGIAYWEIGSGTPIVIVNNWSRSHIELEWTVPSLASFYIELAEKYRVVRFDPRGIGLSDDPPGGWGATTASGVQQGMSTHHMGLDISAVATECGLDNFVLLAIGLQGPVCIEYAATHPNSVTQLILCTPVTRIKSSHLEAPIRVQAAIRRAEEESGLALQEGIFQVKNVAVDEGEQWANLMSNALKRVLVASEGLDPQDGWDAESFLRGVVAPTLVLTTADPGTLTDAREIATAISNSQLRVLDADMIPYIIDRTTFLEAIDEVLLPDENQSYDAFISYSHAADGLLAPRLQSGLQRFAKPWWKRRAMRVFRDEASLAANPDLWSSITDALDASAWFVLLLSPDAAESEWVNREVEYWLANKPAERIIPVVTEGVVAWDGEGTVSPPALHGAFPHEPRWVDLRFAKGDDQLDLKHPTFSAAIADIASAIRGVPKDELESEEVRQHRRTIRTALIGGVALVVLLVASVVAGLAAIG